MAVVGPDLVPANLGDAVTGHDFIDNALLREPYTRSLTVPNGEVVTFARRDV